MSRIQVSFINNTFSDVSLFHVEPASGREILEFVMMPGTTSAISRDLPVGLEWRMRNAEDGAQVGTYRTTDADRQQYLVGGHRIGKDDLRIECYGTVDELNSVIGLCRLHTRPQRAEEAEPLAELDAILAGKTVTPSYHMTDGCIISYDKRQKG